MTLVDTNILVYAAGREHAHKRRSAAFLLAVAGGEVEAAIDSEVLQEILHRYRFLGRWKDGAAVYEEARLVFRDVFPVTAEVTDQARRILDGEASLTARDAVHAAVVKVYGLTSICSFDRDFDRIPGLKRIEP